MGKHDCPELQLGTNRCTKMVKLLAQVSNNARKKNLPLLHPVLYHQSLTSINTSHRPNSWYTVGPQNKRVHFLKQSCCTLIIWLAGTLVQCPLPRWFMWGAMHSRHTCRCHLSCHHSSSLRISEVASLWLLEGNRIGMESSPLVLLLWAAGTLGHVPTCNAYQKVASLMFYLRTKTRE